MTTSLTGHDGMRVQVIKGDAGMSASRLELPSPNSEVLDGIIWGRHDCLFTPAYWAAQAWHYSKELAVTQLRLGTTLIEEVAACLLGGHGMPSETGFAAFNAVKRAGLLLGASPTQAEIESVLSRPLAVNERIVHYRFWRQRSRYLASAIRELHGLQLRERPHQQFRDALTNIDGIGPKTASWITRNWLDSDEVAVLDVHILRAGEIIGLFDSQANISRDYGYLEGRFLKFADAISVRTSRLDALIWRQMKFAGVIGLRMKSLSLRPMF